MTVFKIKEMSCSHCVSRIHNLMEEMGVKHEVDLESKTVSIEGDENTIKKAVEELDDIGFTAEKL